MLFNSYIFILLFFPLCLAGYFGLNHFKKETLAQAFLLGMSLWFYGYFHIGYLAIMVTSIVVNYLFTLAMAKTENQKLRKLEVTLAVLLNLGILFYYKYFNFFLENVNRFFGAELTLRTIVLPLGISFFTFQQVSYVVDAYHGEVKQYPFIQYACFVSYFPQLVAGPIVTHDELIPQFLDPEKKQFNWENFAKGLFLFVMGLSKKVLLADVFGKISAWGFTDVSTLDTTNAFFVSLAYTIQIYFDFSGYSDMAIGLGKMMNIDLPVNFDSPYQSLSVPEFWKRWHITLSRFLTKYVYFPLGGSRKGALRTHLNTMVVFVASGLWHGANYTYILWGFVNGLASVLTRLFKKTYDKLHPALMWLLTFGFISMTMMLFRSNSVSEAIVFTKRLFAMEFGPVDPRILEALLLPEIQLLCRNFTFLAPLAEQPAFLLWAFYGGSMLLILGARNAYAHMQDFQPRFVNFVGTAFLLLWCILSFSGVSSFLYFNF